MVYSGYQIMYIAIKQDQSQINVNTLIVLELNPPGVLLLSRGAKIWSCLPVSLKTLNKSKFKRNVRTLLIQVLEHANDYINLDQSITSYCSILLHINYIQ